MTARVRAKPSIEARAASCLQGARTRERPHSMLPQRVIRTRSVLMTCWDAQRQPPATTLPPRPKITSMPRASSPSLAAPSLKGHSITIQQQLSFWRGGTVLLIISRCDSCPVQGPSLSRPDGVSLSTPGWHPFSSLSPTAASTSFRAAPTLTQVTTSCRPTSTTIAAFTMSLAVPILRL